MAVSLGQYVLLGKLANGGMAEVFLARQVGPEGFSKVVVIKRVLPHLAEDPSFIQMFLSEARLVARLNHPNVVTIQELSYDPTSGSYYMAMEYIDGCTIKRFASAARHHEAPLPPEVCCKMIAEGCAGLEYAHNLTDEQDRPLNIVHRDVSPENMLITYGDGHVKIVDFGVAKATITQGHTGVGETKGKFAYMSPEQVRGQKLDRRSDVWAIGVTLYWLLAGERPFGGDNEAAIVQRILETDPPPLHAVSNGISEELSTIVSRALSKDPDKRTPSCAVLQEELEAWMVSSGKVVPRAFIPKLIARHLPPETDPERLARRAILAMKAAPEVIGLISKPSAAPSGNESDPGTSPVLSTPSRDQFAPRADSGISIEITTPKAKRRTTIRRAILLASVGAVIVSGVMVAAFTRRTPAPPPEVTVSEPATAQTPGQAAAPENPAPQTPPSETQAVPTSPATAEPKAQGNAVHVASETTHLHGKPSRTKKSSTKGKEKPIAEAEAKSAENRPNSGPPGTLSLRVVPWAIVYVDGSEIGTTPFAPVALSAGVHSVRLINGELGVTKDLKVTIVSGQTTTEHDVLK